MNFRKSSRLLVRSLIVLLLPCCNAFGQAHPDSEAASLISGYFATYEALDRFDVLIKSDAQWVGDNGYIEEDRATRRVTIDVSGNRCCSVLNASHSKLIKSAEGADEQQTVALHAVVFDGNESWSRSFPQQAGKIANANEIEDALRFNSTVMLPAIGTVGYPMYYGQASDFTDFLAAVRYGAVVFKPLGESDGKYSFFYEIPIPEQFTIRRMLTINPNNLTPVSFQEKVRMVDGKEIAKVREDYTFREINGLFLPTSIVGQKRARRKVDGAKVKGIESYDVQIEWISVNEPIDDSRFAVTLLRDMGEVTSLADPDLAKNE